MSVLEKMNKIMENEQNAQILLDAIIADYGVKDFLECVFYSLNEESQEHLINIALQAAV